MSIDYANKAFLAPMVRVGTLPMRLLALKYGADLVWTEELVDKRIIGCVKKYNADTGATEYWKGKALCFATHPDEKGKVILQLGTADPDLALEAALTLKDDVAGVDLNCGCPKKFSVQGGMGAALLTDPDRLKAILTKLVNNLDLPVTCKIRLLEDEDKTVELAKMIESTGVKALTVHCRTRDQRSSTPARWDELKAVIKAVKSIPVVVNGDVYCWDDIEKAKKATGASSVMIARGAQYNPSAFRKEGLLPYEEVAKEYLKKCIDFDNLFANTKYVILTLNNDPAHKKSELYQKIQRSKTYLAMSQLFGLESYCQQVIEKREKAQKENNLENNTEYIGEKRIQKDNQEEEKSDAKKIKTN
ncbi:hypothetical protein BJ944DRAFT_203224 [Cunninghamella echinulata]|nr:hypothetical protein BJ944DRAFT_203224 [Cunninghamella echinulata]